MKRKGALVPCLKREEEVGQNKKAKRLTDEFVSKFEICNITRATAQEEVKVAKRDEFGGSILTDRAFFNLSLSQPTLKALYEMDFKTTTECLIIDEADWMLGLNFKDEMGEILKCLPMKRHTILFSATQSTEFAKLSFKKKAEENDAAQPKPVYIGVDDCKGGEFAGSNSRSTP